MEFRAGSVPFLNAKPLVWAFEHLGESSPVALTYAWPSKLPRLLETGDVQVALVSSIDALTVSDRTIAADCSISSRGPVMSVRLFSKVPLSEIRELALDASSLTSNALVQIVLREMFGCVPHCRPFDPEPEEMLSQCDACLLIGDNGLLFEGEGLYQLDLGQAWTQLTGLPFVWACWVGRQDLTPRLVRHLVQARQVGESHLATIAGSADDRISAQLAHDYLTTVFDYTLEADQLAALERFREYVSQFGLAEAAPFPRIVEPGPLELDDPVTSSFSALSPSEFSLR